jgi:hypothetical protein
VAGSHSRQWNAEGVPSGVYFYRMQAGSFIGTKKSFSCDERRAEVLSSFRKSITRKKQ